MRLLQRLLAAILMVVALCAPPARSQEPLTPADADKVGRFLDTNPAKGTLHCSFQRSEPYLDFEFRFLMGYSVACPFRSFGGRESTILVFTRVTPQGGNPLLLIRKYHLPAVILTPQLRSRSAEMTGWFAVGEGEYSVEALVVNQSGSQFSQQRWRVRAPHHEGPTITPRTVLPMGIRPWPIHTVKDGGLRVTVLLYLAPRHQGSRPLTAIDSAIVLESLSSLLKQVPCASVRLRAFNLDQQRELFRQDEFDDEGFRRLRHSLQPIELATVSYKALQQQNSGQDMLLNYAREEMLAAHPSDVVIILGRRSQYRQKIPPSEVLERDTPNPQFFYFEYSSSPRAAKGHYPDVVANLTKRLGGTVFEIYDPGSLAHSVKKMLARVTPSGK